MLRGQVHLSQVDHRFSPDTQFTYPRWLGVGRLVSRRQPQNVRGVLSITLIVQEGQSLASQSTFTHGLRVLRTETRNDPSGLAPLICDI